MNRSVALVMLVLLSVPVGVVASVSPAQADCEGDFGLAGAGIECTYSPDEVRDLYANGSSAGYRYKLTPACETGGTVICHEPAVCPDPPGSFMFNVFRSPDTNPPSWTRIGSACLTDADAADLGALTPGMVLEAFRSMDWPEPELTIQPPDGETLVNFDTNFFTTLSEPQTQTVTLIGIQVTIEATPSSYLWHFGDGADDTTSTPGSAYPHLDITHTYARAGELSPSVDVVYSGRYRVGGGAWSDIPGTLTVPGPAVALRVLEAKPQLVG